MVPGSKISNAVSVWQLECSMSCMEPKVVFRAFRSFSARALARFHRRMRNPKGQRDLTAGARFDCNGDCGKVTELGQPLRTALSLDLTLAAEHVQSIWWLLEIARQHQQPVPKSALTNLDLTLRHLLELKKRIPVATQSLQS
jgi:hypothetical protein